MGRRAELSDIKNLVPIYSLNYDNQAELIRSITVETLGKNLCLFKLGDRDSKTFYLLKGQIEVRDGQKVVKLISSGSPEALHPLAPHQPRQFSVVAKTDVDYIAVNNDLMDVLVTWDQTTSYIVTEIDALHQEDNSDWMIQILRSKLFLKVPPANIQKILMRMQQVPVSSGEYIVKQGEAGDYYYILQKGQCEVLRRGTDSPRDIRLAVLNPGDSFGEEALISSAVRNASVRMITDGVLTRLSHTDFNELLKQPVLKEVSYPEAFQLTKSGAQWLDVRLENEHQQSPIRGSINVPLYLLRLRAGKLDPTSQYIVYCDTGRRSATAAYLLSQRGFDVAVLAGGLSASAVPELK